MELKERAEIIKRASVEIISETELLGKLKKSKETNIPLKIKAGFDPTAPDIHLGHTVLLNKLRQFQDLGHMVYLIIGDFTARIGDPSGQNKLRPAMSEDEIKKNASTYQKQVFKILDKKKTKVFFNSRWFDKMSVSDIMKLCRHSTVSQMTARADFKKRLDNNEDVSLLEFMYPLLQAYDSVKLQVDIELGGTDQKFNLLLGRELQKDFNQAPQVVITMPLLEGLDGVKKMSKSLGNYIGINDKPFDMFGKIMSISDTLMVRYYELLTNENLEEIKKIHPMQAKKQLGELIVGRYHNKDMARRAREEFEKVFQRRDNPDDVVTVKLPPAAYTINQVFDMAREEFRKLDVDSRNKLLSLLKHNAIEKDGKKITEANSAEFEPHKQYLLKIGKRRFLRIICE